MAGKRILLVEDEHAVARGLEFALAREGFHVIWADTGKKALWLAEQEAPDLILLDIRLPDLSGFDVCRQLRASGHREPILMVTALDDEVDRVLGLEIGADDYIVKPYSLREVISRIRAQLRRAYGELAADAGGRPIRFGNVVVDFERLQVTRDGRPVELTVTEFRLLGHLLANAGRPCSRDAIIAAVWGYDGTVGSQRTVDVHMRHLREKLEPDPARPRWLVTVRGIGYKFEP